MAVFARTSVASLPPVFVTVLHCIAKMFEHFVTQLPQPRIASASQSTKRVQTHSAGMVER
jgi:hypothetical protein